MASLPSNCFTICLNVHRPVEGARQIVAHDADLVRQNLEPVALRPRDLLWRDGDDDGRRSADLVSSERGQLCRMSRRLDGVLHYSADA